MRPDFDPLDARSVLRLFAAGLDTHRIAFLYGLREAGVANLLARARDARHQSRAADDAVFTSAAPAMGGRP